MVSVALATYNGEAFLREQLESILPQLSGDDELVISDDGSTDQTLAILNSFHHPALRKLPPQHFRSPVKNFAYVLQHCQGEIIFLADQDDVWHPEKIKVMKQALVDSDLVVCDSRLINTEGTEVNPSFFRLTHAGPGLFKNIFQNSFVGCCMAFRREILERALPFPAIGVLHDQWIGLIAEKSFRVKFLPQILVDYRRHDGNYSTTGSRSRKSIGKKLFLRLRIAWCILTRS